MGDCHVTSLRMPGHIRNKVGSIVAENITRASVVVQFEVEAALGRHLARPPKDKLASTNVSENITSGNASVSGP
jgi:hypothetical protein